MYKRQHIISASDDNSLKLWDAKSGQEILSLSGHSNSVLSAAFSPDGKHIISASADHSLKLWDAKSGQPIRDYYHLPNGQFLAREPWDKEEAAKPPHEMRWKFLAGSPEVWRYCHVVDRADLSIHPYEYAIPGWTPDKL